MTGDKKKTTLGDRLGKTAAAQGQPQKEGAEICQELEGNLRDKPISWLLKVAQYYEVTGMLLIGSAACNVSIQFGLGRAVNAHSPFCTGSEAIMDLFIWKDGKVRFEFGKPPQSVSIQESMEDIVMRGESYVENLSFLERNAINEMSFLMRPPGKVDKAEVERRLSMGQKIDLGMQMEFFSNTYGTRNIKDTAEKMDLPPSRWVSIVANLLQLGILLAPDGRNLQLREPAKLNVSVIAAEAAAGPAEPAEQQWPVPPAMATSGYWIKVGIPEYMVALDPALKDAVWLLLNKPQTGILSFEVLHFFLDREFVRAYRFRTVLSLVVFCLRLQANDNHQHLSVEACALFTGAINQIKRDVDLLGHFGQNAFALVLPNVESDQACFLADKINADLLRLKPELAAYQPSLHFGIASVPMDATDLNGLVQAAQTAMFEAAKRNLLKVQANEMRA